jgi:hypothetical protein
MEEYSMKTTTTSSLEARKKWLTPVLKKMDVEKVTAVGSGWNNDGNGAS